MELSLSTHKYLPIIAFTAIACALITPQLTAVSAQAATPESLALDMEADSELQGDESLAIQKGPIRNGSAAHIYYFTRHVGALIEKTWWSDQNNGLLGAVHRDLWRQWFRSHFVLYDQSEGKLAEGTQPWSIGILFNSLAPLHITDADGSLLLDIKGIAFTTSTKQFQLKDAHGIYIADAWVDGSGQSVAFSYANKPYHRFAALNQKNATSAALWQLTVRDSDIIPELAWPVLAAFFGQAAEASARDKQREKEAMQDYKDDERMRRYREGTL